MRDVDHPDHYGGKDNPYEAIKVIEAWGLGFHLGNVVKYISRADKKGEKLTDLRKAAWYLQRLIGGEPAPERDEYQTDHQLRVEAMRRAFGQRVPDSPEVPSEEERVSQALLILEEAFEVVEALGVRVEFINNRGLLLNGNRLYVQGHDGVQNITIEHIAKELADLSVVTIGAMNACGLPDRPILEAVDENNMTKAESGRLDENGKFQKPAGHQPPDMAYVIDKIKAKLLVRWRERRDQESVVKTWERR